MKDDIEKAWPSSNKVPLLAYLTVHIITHPPPPHPLCNSPPPCLDCLMSIYGRNFGCQQQNYDKNIVNLVAVVAGGGEAAK